MNTILTFAVIGFLLAANYFAPILRFILKNEFDEGVDNWYRRDK